MSPRALIVIAVRPRGRARWGKGAGPFLALSTGYVIVVKTSHQRFRSRTPGKETWRTFHPETLADPWRNGFRTLECFNEEDLAPGVGTTLHLRKDLELLTYVRVGSLIHEDTSGRRNVIEAGECRRSSAASGTTHRTFNRSTCGNVRTFQCCIIPDREHIQFRPEQRRFPMAERRGILRPLASPDGRAGSLRLHQDLRVYSSILDPGQHLVHELAPSRGAWLHVISGGIRLIDQDLREGDGASLVEEPAVSLTAKVPSEILLFDIA